MTEQGRGCRHCEVDKLVVSIYQHKYNILDGMNFGLSYAIYRCDKCGAFWSECRRDGITTEWFCFGREIGDIKSYEELYQNMVQPKRKWYSVDWLIINLVLMAILCVLFLSYSAFMYYLREEVVVPDIYAAKAVEESLTFNNIWVTTGRTTIIDLRNGYLTNHTVIVFEDDGNVVQYGEPKNLCYTSNTVTVLNP